MKAQTLILSSILFGSALASSVQADSLRLGQRHNFQAEITRSTGTGHGFTRRTEQAVSGKHFQRTTQIVTEQGKKAKRTVKGGYDQASQTYTRTMESTHPNGETVSSVRETSKTADGMVRTQTRTNADGQSASKEVTVSFDHENQVQTRNVEATGYAGGTFSASASRSYSHGGDE